MYKNDDIDYLKYLLNKDVLIFGAGVQGKVCFHKLKIKKIKVIGYIDNNKRVEELNHIPVYSFDWLKEHNSSNVMIIISSRYEREMKMQLLDNCIFNFISESQIDFGGGSEHYDENYFKWQKGIGKFGAEIKVNMFKPYITKDMTVVEYGSGGGYLLNLIDARVKLGIEINDSARAEAEALGIKSVAKIDDVADEFADVIISTSVLEHVENPFEAIKKLRSKLKNGGKIVFHVPNESCETEYRRSDINNHLYTWNCLNIGNLFKAAGYFVYSVERVQEVWPKNYMQLHEQVSDELFAELCYLGGRTFQENRCIIVAYK